MKKLFTISFIPVFAFLLLGAFAAVPADAQGPSEQCTLVRNIKITFGTTPLLVVDKGSVITSSPTTTIADSGGTSIPAGPDLNDLATKWGTICLINTINVVVDWIFLFLVVLAVAFIAIAGFMWMTGRGDPEKQKAAGQMIAAALVGIVIAILARILPAVITGILL